MPSSPMAKTPISSAEPKRFLVARSRRSSWRRSPSRYSTVSTICSRTLGPAIEPSFVTCPTRKTGTLISLASRMSLAADSRTWVTLPALPSNPASVTVWIESMIASSGASPRIASQMASRSFSARSRMPGSRALRRSARIRTCWPDSSPETYRTLPRLATWAAACIKRVDLPTPGSPPIRTRLPGTTPPPSTRLSSPQASLVRGESSGAISLRGIARAGRSGRDLESLAAFRTWNSWSVFHAPQCGHWPAQRRLSPPHSVQTKVIVDLGMQRLYPGLPVGEGGRSFLQGAGVGTCERQDAALTYPRGGVAPSPLAGEGGPAFPSPLAGEGGPAAKRPGRMGRPELALSSDGGHFPSPLAGEGGPCREAAGPDGDTRAGTILRRWTPSFAARRGRWPCFPSPLAGEGGPDAQRPGRMGRPKLALASQRGRVHLHRAHPRRGESHRSRLPPHAAVRVRAAERADWRADRAQGRVRQPHPPIP